MSEQLSKAGDKEIYLYVGIETGGCADVGKIRLDGWTLVSDEVLSALRATDNGKLIEALRVARLALRTPDGRTKTKKADQAVALINSVIGED